MFLHTNGLQGHEKMLTVPKDQGNANQTSIGYCLSLDKMVVIRKKRSWQNVEKLECLYTLGRNVKWFCLYRKHHEGVG